MERYRVRVANDSLVFSAAHFITVGKNTCERLHGHNYRVAAEIQGPLDAHQCVVDFVTLRAILRSLLDELDHRMLLPAAHPLIGVTADDREVLVSWDNRRWVFPRDDCALLPVANTTAESLAQYLGQRLSHQLLDRLGIQPDMLRIEVGECAGQSAIWERSGP